MFLLNNFFKYIQQKINNTLNFSNFIFFLYLISLLSFPFNIKLIGPIRLLDFFILTIFLLLLLTLKKENIKKIHINWIIIPFFIVIFYSLTSYFSFNEIRIINLHNLQNIFFYYKYLAVFLMLFNSYFIIDSTSKIKITLYILLILYIFLILIIFYNYYHSFVFNFIFTNLYSHRGDYQNFGMNFFIISIFLYYIFNFQENKFKYLILLMIIFFSFFGTSRTPLFLFLIFLIIEYLFNTKLLKIFPLIVLLSLILFYLIPSLPLNARLVDSLQLDYYNYSRIFRSLMLQDWTHNKIIFGQGFMNYYGFYDSLISHIVANFGLLGLILFILLFQYQIYVMYNTSLNSIYPFYFYFFIKIIFFYFLSNLITEFIFTTRGFYLISSILVLIIKFMENNYNLKKIS